MGFFHLLELCWGAVALQLFQGSKPLVQAAHLPTNNKPRLRLWATGAALFFSAPRVSHKLQDRMNMT